MRVKDVLITGVCLMAGWAALVRAEEAAVPVLAPVALSASSVASKPVHSMGHKLIFYLPNRFLDLVDIIRFRLRIGPGLAADARMTMYAANFIGKYDSCYAGLPGPRRAPVLPRPFGREALKGLLVMGVDATDATPYPPRYSDSEMTMGAQAGIVGFDVGLDPIELGDFLTGWVLVDITGDDL